MIQVLFWFNIGLIFFIYFVFPLVIFIIAKVKGKEAQKDDITPFVSLIIPMHNEEGVVKEKIENTLSLDYPTEKIEIIFALDGCTDKTKDYLLECKDNRIKILENNERLGKVATLNKTVLQAKGEIIVFSDANSMHEKNALRTLIRHFTDKKVGCVSGRLSYTSVDKTSVGKGENLYWKYETFLKKQESELGKLLITNGSIHAVRKEVYPFPDPDIADDFSIPLLIQVKGYKVLYEPQAVVYEIATQSIKEEFNQKVRIVSQGIKGAVRLRRDLLKLSPIGLFELFFHKVLRWFVFLSLIIVFLANLILMGEKFYFNLFILQIVFYCFALIGFLLRHNNKIKAFYVPFYFCLVNLASLVALYRFLRGSQTRTWDKAHSTRIKKVENLDYV